MSPAPAGMTFSCSLPILVDRTSPDPYRAMTELARVAESSGFTTVTVGHHHFMPENLSDPLTVLAAVASRTDRIRVGTGIFQLPVHHPLRVAEQVATVDELSGGRVSLGVGLGWWATEYEAFGSVFAERGDRMDEALEILVRAWSGEPTSFDGRFYRFPEVTVHPRPVQRPHPPLWVAGVADRAVRRAARRGDAWIAGPVQSLGAVRSCLAVYRDECAVLSRPAEWILRRYAWVGTDGEQVRAEVLPRYVDGLLAHWRDSVEEPAERALFDRIDAGERVGPEEIAADRLLWGDPEQVVAQIGRYRRETGCTHLHAAFGAGLPADTDQPSGLGDAGAIAAMMERFGSEVIPAFA